jgi:hypothetical protein
MKIEVLYIDGCPNTRPALERLKSVMQQERIAAEVAEIEIGDDAAARRLKFPGSPTIRINGLDIDVEARTSGAIGFACRRYEDGLPSESVMRRAIKEATEGASHE